MIVTTMLGGFALWLIARHFLSRKTGTLAIACFFVCFLVALLVDLWLSKDLLRLVVAHL